MSKNFFFKMVKKKDAYSDKGTWKLHGTFVEAGNKFDSWKIDILAKRGLRSIGQTLRTSEKEATKGTAPPEIPMSSIQAPPINGYQCSASSVQLERKEHGAAEAGAAEAGTCWQARGIRVARVAVRQTAVAGG